MRILVACEESQVVTAAFRERGHDAYSCAEPDVSGDCGGHGGAMGIGGTNGRVLARVGS